MKEVTWTQERWEAVSRQHSDPRYIWVKNDYGWCDSKGSVSYIEIIKELGCKSVLDYGCGAGKTFDSLKPEIEITNYDPWIPEFSKFPSGKFDIVTCVAVLNNVDQQFMDDVLTNLKEFTRGPVLINISIRPDNTPVEFYMESIKKHFKVIRTLESEPLPSALDQVMFYRLFLHLEKLT